MLKGQKKKDYQKQYMRDYMRQQRIVKAYRDGLLRPNVKTPELDPLIPKVWCLEVVNDPEARACVARLTPKLDADGNPMPEY